MQKTYFLRPPLPLSPDLPVFGVASAVDTPALAAGVAAVAATVPAATAAAASFSIDQTTWYTGNQYFLSKKVTDKVCNSKGYAKYTKFENNQCHATGNCVPCRISSSFLKN
jgi:hypothetical protein